MERRKALIGSIFFFFLAPGLVAGLAPWLISGWKFAPALFTPAPLAGLVFVALGVASLVDSFRRFALEGNGTPAITHPPVKLVVDGQYRFVRNPMYLAVIAVIAGEGMLIGNALLFFYGGFVFLCVDLFVKFYEEPTLREKFGHDYYLYCAGVHRWIPRRRPWAGPEGDLRMSPAQKEQFK